MKKYFRSIMIAAALVASLSSCNQEQARESHLVYFSPTEIYTRIGGIDCYIDGFNGTITNTELLPADFDLTKVKIHFKTNNPAKVYVKGVEQVSGVTVNNFTSPVVYEVKNEAGVKKYTVTLTKSENIKTQVGLRIASLDFVEGITAEKETWLAQGLRMTSVDFTATNSRSLTLNLFEIDMTRPELGLRVLTPDNGSEWKRQTLSDQIAAASAAGVKVLGAVNADFFDMETGVPQGVVCQDGRYLKDLVDNPSASAFFGIRNDGRAAIGVYSDFQVIQDKMVQAIGGFEYLSMDDGPMPNLDETTLANRTTAGMNTSDLKTVYLMTVSAPDRVAISLAENADIMLALGAGFSLRLDGGGSSTFIAAGEGNSFETYCPQGTMRAIANGLAIIKK